MKKIIFGLLGLLLPVFVGIWFYGFFNSESMDSMMAPIVLFTSAAH